MTLVSPSEPSLSTSGGGEPEGVAHLGSPAARLLAGPIGREGLSAHHERLGPLPDWSRRTDELVATVREAGLGGRGGGYFPLASKLQSARSVPGPAVIVINATESEPASAKDRTLLEHRPHLVLDGAQALAAAVAADRIIVATHRGAAGPLSLRAALEERRADRVATEAITVPDGYVAGESSALVSFINGGPARPTARLVPTAISGVAGRPTVVSNAETASHLALIARFGAQWFRQAGSTATPGSVLLTLQGDVSFPGRVVEVLQPVTLGAIIAACGGPPTPPRAVLLGGYAGTWLRGERAWVSPVDAAGLAVTGASLGCGLVGVLGPGRCGLAEAARLMRWLSEERAGQCGACTMGLPAVSERLTGIADGTRRRRREVHRLVALGEAVSGRGLCGLPDGAVAMVDSALAAFPDELRLHRKGRCSSESDAPVFPRPRSRS